MSTARLFVPVDVNLPDDPKIVAAGPLAEHVYLRGLMLAKRIGGDGFIHRGHLVRLAGDLCDTPGEVAARLVSAGLWVVDNDGWRIVAWLGHNPSDAEIETRREQERERKKAWRTNSTRRERDVGQERRATVGPSDLATRSKSKSKSESFAADRPRDEIFDALCETCRIDPKELTSSARGAVNKAVKELRRLEVTDADVRARADAYRAQYPTVALTPSALVKHWPALAANRGTMRADATPRVRLGRGVDAAPEWVLGEDGQAYPAPREPDGLVDAQEHTFSGPTRGVGASGTGFG